MNGVLRRPLLSACSGGILVALAAPALQLLWRPPGRTPSQSLALVKTYDRSRQAFPGTALPATVVVQGAGCERPGDAIRRSVGRSGRRSRAATGRFADHRRDDPAGTVASITVPIEGTGTDAAIQRMIRWPRCAHHRARHRWLSSRAAKAGVTGLTAQWKDSQEQMQSKLPLVVGFVLLFAFGIMLVAFRSVVIAAKAIVLNLLSVPAAYGVLVLVFQTASARACLASARPPASRPSCRCCCS